MTFLPAEQIFIIVHMCSFIQGQTKTFSPREEMLAYKSLIIQPGKTVYMEVSIIFHLGAEDRAWNRPNEQISFQNHVKTRGK